MSNQYRYTFTLTLQRTEGKQAKKAELAGELATMFEDLEIYGVGADQTSIYEVTDVSWSDAGEEPEDANAT